jgi:hypothetical protein
VWGGVSVCLAPFLPWPTAMARGVHITAHFVWSHVASLTSMTRLVPEICSVHLRVGGRQRLALYYETA